MLTSPEPSRRPEDQPSVPPSRRHNFSFTSWGNTRHLRCVKLDDGSGGEVAGSDLRPSAKMSPPLPEKSPDESSPATRPWNLRTRRAACYTPREIGRKRNHSSPPSNSPSPLQLEKNCPPKSIRSKSEENDREKGERAKFLGTLSYEEIEEDYLLLKGTKPPRRPKKRAKILQKQLDLLFPGSWLSEITADSYKIEE